MSKHRFIVPVTVQLDMLAHDAEDAHEITTAWADALQEGDYMGLSTLKGVSKARPSFGKVGKGNRLTEFPTDDPSPHRPGWPLD